MATAKEIRTRVADAVDYALGSEPGDDPYGRRYACFVAYLTGLLMEDEPRIATDLRRLRRLPPANADGA